MSKPSPLGDLIRVQLAGLGIARRIKEAGIAPEWPNLVGPEIAAHTEVSKLHAGTLFVAVEDPAWRQELIFQKEMIRQKINDVLGEGEMLIREIIFSGPGIKKKSRHLRSE